MWGASEGLVQDRAALLLTTQYLEEADRLAGDEAALSQPTLDDAFFALAGEPEAVAA
jgi:hypothetical protein